jgi:hypothetical protein
MSTRQEIDIVEGMRHRFVLKRAVFGMGINIELQQRWKWLPVWETVVDTCALNMEVEHMEDMSLLIEEYKLRLIERLYRLRDENREMGKILGY